MLAPAGAEIAAALGHELANGRFPGPGGKNGSSKFFADARYDQHVNAPGQGPPGDGRIAQPADANGVGGRAGGPGVAVQDGLHFRGRGEGGNHGVEEGNGEGLPPWCVFCGEHREEMFGGVGVSWHKGEGGGEGKEEYNAGDNRCFHPLYNGNLLICI